MKVNGAERSARRPRASERKERPIVTPQCCNNVYHTRANYVNMNFDRLTKAGDKVNVQLVIGKGGEE